MFDLLRCCSLRRLFVPTVDGCCSHRCYGTCSHHTLDFPVRGLRRSRYLSFVTTRMPVYTIYVTRYRICSTPTLSPRFTTPTPPHALPATYVYTTTRSLPVTRFLPATLPGSRYLTRTPCVYHYVLPLRLHSLPLHTRYHLIPVRLFYGYRTATFRLHSARLRWLPVVGFGWICDLHTAGPLFVIYDTLHICSDVPTHSSPPH